MRTRRIRGSHVAITHNHFEGEAIKEGWSELPLENFIKSGETVVVTPNWVKNVPPSTGTIVGPGSLQVILEIVKGYNPGRVVVACGSGGADTHTVLAEQGFFEVIEDAEVEFIDLNYGPYTELELENCIPEKIMVNRLLDDADVIISYTQIKQHEEATVTLGIKNIALSWPPAEKHGFPKTKLGIHHNLHPFIAAMGKAIPIDLTILSGTQGMVGTGPSGGKPVNSGLMVMGTDPVSTDCVGARLLGFMPQAVSYLWELIQDRVGEGNLNKVKFSGLPLNHAEEIFSQAAYGHLIKVDDGVLRGIHI